MKSGVGAGSLRLDRGEEVVVLTVALRLALGAALYRHKNKHNSL